MTRPLPLIYIAPYKGAAIDIKPAYWADGEEMDELGNCSGHVVSVEMDDTCLVRLLDGSEVYLPRHRVLVTR